MVHFFIGTKAQFIKMAPVMVEMQKRGIAYRYIDSGQHGELTRSLRQTFGIREPDVNLSKNGRDITTMAAAAKWMFRFWMYCIFNKKWLREKVFSGGGICLVHGDTLSTLLGLRMAKAAGLAVGHVEAGLRSYNYFNPFPEELIRLYCMKRCDVLFAPSREAEKNLHSMRIAGKIVLVDGNTVVDALRLVENANVTVKIPSEPYALAACHRLETITNRPRLEKIIDLLNRVASEMRVIFVIHKPTQQYLEKFDLKKKISSGVDVLGMQDYMNFTALMRNAKMVLADGGSIQEECSYLDKPCLILRHKTERPDGLGRNAMLWEFKAEVLEGFLKTVKNIRLTEQQWPQPSKQIVDNLEKHYGQDFIPR
ncbi:MAG: UDP-N-acetylglucosamine 2-epimerase [Smithella sp.]